MLVLYIEHYIEQRMTQMKSMTIHGIDQQLAELIKSKAQSEGLSVNKTIKKLLEAALGIRPAPGKKNLEDFKEFCGLWAETDLKEFEENTSDTRRIHTEDWQ
jgi:hypothetical protein